MKVKKEHNSSKNWLLGPVLQIATLLFFGAVAAVLTVYLSYQIAYRQRIFPGINVLGINVGNKTTAEALSLLNKKLPPEASSTDLDSLVKKAYAIGRESDFLTNSKEQAYAWFSHYNLQVKTAKAQPYKTVDLTKPTLDLLGVGQSKFTGSPPNRLTNIRIASSFINDKIVPAGEVFSFYDAIGGVSPEKGYREAYVISGGRTQLDFGGGVCQVSTTLFRAALNSGLPIVERHPHSYRITYYEQDSLPGLDASIYFPYTDFKFKNDTGGDLVIKAQYDSTLSTLKVEFYGLSDGRKVAISAPTLLNQIQPLPDLNQDDPTLPVGTIKQVDFSAWGATTSFNRTVTRDGVLLTTDTFTSVYQPWQAIFLHGTKIG